MILSDEGIRQALACGELGIEPCPTEDQFTSSALDLCLGSVFKGWNESALKAPGVNVTIDLAEQDFPKTAKGYLISQDLQADGSFILQPHKFVLAQTHERVTLSAKLAARVEGRSSFARLGLLVHLTAPTIHANFNGPIVLEIINFGPFDLKLVPVKTRICQLIFERLETPATGEPRTAFQRQTDPSGAP